MARKFSELMEPIMRDPVRRARMEAITRAMEDALLVGEIRERREDDPFGGSQPRRDIGRIVSEDDAYLWALKSGIEMLGGELKVTATFPDGETIRIA